MSPADITVEDVDAFYKKLKEEIESKGYHLNPDEVFTKELLESILINQSRYGYGACPCRLASGIKEEDLDIICPCDYRDPDLNEFGACYCGLYISKEILNGEKKTKFHTGKKTWTSRTPIPGKIYRKRRFKFFVFSSVEM